MLTVMQFSRAGNCPVEFFSQKQIINIAFIMISVSHQNILNISFHSHKAKQFFFFFLRNIFDLALLILLHGRECFISEVLRVVKTSTGYFEEN